MRGASAQTGEPCGAKVLANGGRTVHVEPAAGTNDEADAIRELAKALGLALHAVRIREISGRLYVNFHVEMPPQSTLAQAHKVVTNLEERIRLRLPSVAEIDSHIEPAVGNNQ